MTDGGRQTGPDGPIRWLRLGGALALFVGAILLLGASLELVRGEAQGLLQRTIDSPASALGAGWLVSYLVLSATFVADLAVALLHVGLLTPVQAFLGIVGSRLGAGGIVVLVGALHFLQTKGSSLRDSVELGVLTFLVSHTIFLPAGLLGYLALGHLPGAWLAGRSSGRLPLEGVLVLLPSGTWFRVLLLVISLALLYLSIRAIDAQLGQLDLTRFRDDHVPGLHRPWIAALAGLVLTALTTSVAFSLGLLVPLYNEELLSRREMVPYILGAGIGTFSDTLLVAVILGSGPGLVVLALVILCAVVVTLIALLLVDRYLATIDTLLGALTATRRRFVAFAASLVAVPALLALL